MAGEFTHNEELDLDPETSGIKTLGEGVKLVKEDKVEFTKELAYELLEMPELAGDRNLIPAHVSMLLRQMERGTFRPEHVLLAVCRCNESCRDRDGKMHPAGTTWRLNGQHTSWARVEMDQPFRATVKHLRYTAKTAHDMRVLYGTFDRNKMRTRQNVMDSILDGRNEFSHLKRSHLKQLTQGFRVWRYLHSTEANQHDPEDDAYQILTEYQELFLKVADFVVTLQHRDFRFLLRSPTVGAMFATFDKTPKIAREQFWEQVRDGVGFTDKNDPRNRLRTSLISTSVNSGGGAVKSDKAAVDRETMYRWCLVAWNAFREGRPLKVMKVPKSRPKLK